MATSAQHSDSMGLSTHVAKAAALPLRLRRARPTPAATLTTATATATATAIANDHDFASTKNVVVLGGSFAGMHAATVLAQKLPPTHRVILVDRNSHFNHLYVFPRFSVLPGHEQKAFIPYTSIFSKAPSRARHDPSDSAATVSTSHPVLRATTATAPTFDLEMGSTAGATREQSATATTAVTATATSSSSPTSSEPFSSSSSTSSFSLSSPIDDEGTYPDSARSRNSSTGRTCERIWVRPLLLKLASTPKRM
ncbi:hypothetical protein CF336_g5428 [Tilletia laevis]|nr:hypothetical protein CF336_g5428 [Tilletia laevis]KAE8191886.1 hypothetical protein CF335_g5970 [Tilletia laevis]